MSYGIHNWIPQALQTMPTTVPTAADYDSDIIRGAGLIDEICQYLYYRDEPWHIDDKSDHLSVITLTSTHYYVANLSTSRRDTIYFHRLGRRARQRQENHVHLLAQRPYFAQAYASHGWPHLDLNTALIALTQFDVAENIFKYMYADEIMTFTTTAEYMSAMTARREILDSLRARRRRQNDDDAEAEAMAQLAQDIDTHNPPLPTFPDSD